MSDLKVIGMPLERIPIKTTKERDLLYFEGPLISLHRGPFGDPYIELWVDRDRLVDRWLMFRTTELDLARYVHGKVALRQIALTAPDAFFYVNDYSRSGEHRAALLPIAETPSEILPREGALHDPSLEPRQETDQVDQSILLSGSWEMSELSDLQRRYSQVYSLQSVLGVGQAPPPEKLSEAFANYNFNGGYVYKTAFDRFEHAVLFHKRPKFTAVHYASPGYIRLKVDSDDAARAGRAVRSFLESSEELRKAYDALHASLLAFGRETRDGDQVDGKQLEAWEKSLTPQVRALSGMLGLSYVALMYVAGNSIVSGFILASYFRRLKDLALLQFEERADIV